MHSSWIALAGAVAVCAAGTALAQTRTDRLFEPGAQDCSDVRWSQEVLREYPQIAAACREVEQRDGKTYVKFEGTVREVTEQGRQVRIDFKGGDTLTLAPPENAVLYMNDRRTSFSRLRRGDELNFYVPEDQLTAQFVAEAAGETVDVPIVSERDAAATQPQERQRVAQAELPRTASALPLLALSGGIIVLLGAGMTLYRRFRV